MKSNWHRTALAGFVCAASATATARAFASTISALTADAASMDAPLQFSKAAVFGVLGVLAVIGLAFGLRDRSGHDKAHSARATAARSTDGHRSD